MLSSYMRLITHIWIGTAEGRKEERGDLQLIIGPRKGALLNT